MTREEHVKLAVHLDEQAINWWGNGDSRQVTEAHRDYARFLVSRAQVHATLAAAADPEVRLAPPRRSGKAVF